MQTTKLQFIVLGGANAGKSSILRRYFYNRFDHDRMPTMGADYFSRRIDYPIIEVKGEDEDAAAVPYSDEKKDGSTTNVTGENQTISIQVWDTPGRERYSHLENKNRKAQYTASFSDNFLRNADAAVLVYDVSSSTSFTHVLKWHSELMEQLRRMEAIGDRRRPLPILIVGNKIDIVQERDTQKELRKMEVVRQRKVMGFQGNDFRGNDYRYEYTASSSPSSKVISPSSSSSLSQSKNSSSKSRASREEQAPSRSRFELSTYMGTKTSYLESILNNEVYRGSYLDSLLSSEDKSHPDKDMVLLWCMRNGLMHLDVSAKTGDGITELMDQLVKTALEQRQKDRELRLRNSGTKLSDLRTNDELDLHRRYAPKGRSCFGLSLQNCCKPSQ